jgi:hypothetical protein
MEIESFLAVCILLWNWIEDLSDKFLLFFSLNLIETVYPLLNVFNWAFDVVVVLYADVLSLMLWALPTLDLLWAVGIAVL